MARKSFLNQLIRTPRKVCFLDLSGAFVSMVCLGLILPNLEQYTSIPKITYYKLALFACFFLFFSFTHLIRSKPNWKIYFISIVFFNAIYLIVTLLFTLNFNQQLLPIEVLYFSLELIILLCVIWIEYRALRQVRCNR